MRIFTKTAFLIFLLGYASFSLGQRVAGDTLQEFKILQAASLRSINIDSVTTLQTAAGNVIIQQEGNTFYADSAVMNPLTHVLEAFGNIHINQGDSVHTYGRYLRYKGEEKLAYIRDDVRLTDGKGTLVTQEMDYNLDLGIGNFYKGGKVTEGKNVIKSQNGTYFADTKDVYFKKDVVVTGDKNLIKADSLLYNMETKISSFISPTYIKNNEVELTTTQGTYDLKTGNALFTERTNVTDSSGRKYSANHIALDGPSGNVQLEGNAVVVDTANSFMLLANQIFMNRKNNSFLATRKPLLIVKQKNDSTFIAADTIFSGLKINMLTEAPGGSLNTTLDEDKRVAQALGTDSLGNSKELADSLSKVNGDSLRVNLPGSRGDSLDVKMPVVNDTVRLAQDSLGGKVDSLRLSRDSLPISQDRFGLNRDSGQVNRDTSLLSEDLMRPKRDSLRSKTATRRARKDTVGLHRDTVRIQRDTVDISRSPVLDETLQIRKDSATISSDTVGIAGDYLLVKQNELHKDVISPNANDTLPAIPLDSTDRGKRLVDSTGANGLAPAMNDSTIRYFMAFHNVRIFNDSLQGASDSLYFSTEDSVFRLYKDPVLWSGQSQITGDTIYLFTKNKEPERLYVFEKGMIVNRTQEGFFNQMAGKTINGYFVNGKIDYLRVKGSQSQSIYYMQDEDNLYIAMNRTVADVIDMFFENDELQKVSYVNEVKGRMYPMGQIPDEERLLPNFKWLEERRPKSKFELYE